MPLVTQNIPALHGGVSQQAAIQRNRNQVEQATNVSFSVVDGSSKRPPLECVHLLGVNQDDNVAVTWFQARDGEWYVLTFPGDGSYRAYKVADGLQVPLEGDSTGLDYLTTEGPAYQSMRFQQVGEKLYVVNREKQCVMLPDSAPGALAGSAMTLQDDHLGNAAVNSIWEIAGSQTTPFDTYYVKKVASNPNDKFVEWIQPEITYKIDPASMPHSISILPAEGLPEQEVFKFDSEEWAERRVGDQNSNAVPSFIGERINNLTMAGDRLVIMSRRSISMSRVGKYNDFWRSTVTQVLDDDRIDVTEADTETTDLYWMEPVSGQYVVFSKTTQYVLDGQPALTPRTVSMKPVTKFPISVNIPPASIGPNCYFTTEAGQFSHLREMFLQEDAVTLDAANVSSHVPKYIPRELRDTAAHPAFDALFMVPLDESSLYVYEFMWAGDEKVMSAWGRWYFPGGIQIVNVHVVDHYLYVVYYHNGEGDGLYLGRINLKRGDSEPGFQHRVHLDHLNQAHRSYSAGSDRTTFFSRFPIDYEIVSGSGVLGTATSVFSFPVSGNSKRFAVLEEDVPAGFDIEKGTILADNGVVSSTNVVQVPFASAPGVVEFDVFYEPGDLTNPGNLNDTVFTFSMPVEGGDAYSEVVMVNGKGTTGFGISRKVRAIPGFQQEGPFSFSLPGDWSNHQYWIGYSYRQRLRMSEQFFLENNVPVLNARLQLRNMQVHYTDTGFFNVWVKARGSDPFMMPVYPGLKHTYTSRTLGDEHLTLNNPQRESGVYDFPVLGRAPDVTIDLINDSYLPANFQSAEWRGLISRRTTR